MFQMYRTICKGIVRVKGVSALRNGGPSHGAATARELAAGRLHAARLRDGDRRGDLGVRRGQAEDGRSATKKWAGVHTS